MCVCVCVCVGCSRISTENDYIFANDGGTINIVFQDALRN